MRKTIGIVRPAFTAKPLAFPGSHLGMALTSRTASFARDGSTGPTAFMSVIVPSLLTMKLTLTSRVSSSLFLKTSWKHPC